MSLFEDRGFDHVTVDEVAAAAEIAPRTFFHYFPTKEDVVLADYAERLDRLVTVLRDGPTDGSAWRALRAGFATVSADHEHARDDMLRRMRILASAPSVAARSLHIQAEWERAVAEIVGEWLGDASDADPVVPRLLAGAALAAMRASIALWVAGGGRGSLPALVEGCFDLLESGLGGVGIVRPA